MVPPDEPPPPVSDAPPSPPPHPGPAPAPVPVRRRRGPNRFQVLVAGVVVGVLAGGTAGFFLFNGKKVVAPIQALATPTPSASPTPTATPLPTQPPATSTAAPVQGVVACPVSTPTNQHPLGNPGNGPSGQAPNPNLEFCGRGSAEVPTGTARFMTGNNWDLGIADSCPTGSSGQGGMGTVLTISEVSLSGAAGPDSAPEGGDWAESGGTLMATGGNWQLRVTAVSPDCVWHIAIYPT
jgi:hypothetical protein